MEPVIVKAQKELNKALKEKAELIYIESPSGVWIYVGQDGILQDQSSTVEARGSPRVEARESSTVVARESSRVEARESSRVEAWGSSTVVAWESSRVEARESSRVEVWESYRVVAAPFVAIHLHSSIAQVKGGVLIDLTKLDLTDSKTWLNYHGAKIEKDYVILYKAVNNDYQTDRGAEWTYAPSNKVVARDFKPTKECGQGLHLGVTPRHCKNFYQEATKFVAVKTKVKGLIPLGDKCKVESCEVLYEVNEWGDKL